VINIKAERLSVNFSAPDKSSWSIKVVRRGNGARRA
jgi:hypothetical protein